MSTPLQISIALHYWTRATDYGSDAPDFNINAPAVIEQRSQMVAARLLNPSYGDGGRLYMPGPALECYIDALCAAHVASHADARLIAAAPDMLAALHSVVASLKELGIDGWSEAPYLLSTCRAAIAKAGPLSSTDGAK